MTNAPKKKYVSAYGKSLHPPKGSQEIGMLKLTLMKKLERLYGKEKAEIFAWSMYSLSSTQVREWIDFCVYIEANFERIK